MIKRQKNTKRSYDDQTDFASGSLLYEPVSNWGSEALSTEELEARKKKNRSVYLGVGIIVLILLSVAVFAYFKSRQPVPKVADEEVDLETIQELTGPFKSRLLELEEDLEKADPDQETLPFPPVDFTITLEE